MLPTRDATPAQARGFLGRCARKWYRKKFVIWPAPDAGGPRAKGPGDAHESCPSGNEDDGDTPFIPIRRDITR